MDPNALLELIRQHIADVHKARSESDDFGVAIAADALAESFNDLDAWLTRGGHLPQAWER